MTIEEKGQLIICDIKKQTGINTVRIMKQMYGIDMDANGQHNKLIDEIPEPDIIISMGCDVGCPYIGRPFDDDWGLIDPTGKDDDTFKKVILQIESKIKELKR